jgi:uncharacterized delta-60 repeat protein
VKPFHSRLTPGRLAIHLGMACLVAAASVVAFAQAGQLDATFADKGVFSDNFSGATGAATAVALQSDGKILVGGSDGSTGVVLRLTTNGAIDTSFGSAGIVTINFRVANNVVTGLAIQTDGKVVVAGTGIPGGGRVARFDADGQPDNSFGTDGETFIFPGNPGALVILTSGDIVVLEGNVLQRFTSNGTLDTTFANSGTAPLVFGGSSIALLSNGEFLISPSTVLFGPGALARYTSNGSLDRSFGISGQSSPLAVPALALQSDGKIISAGSITTGAATTGNPGGFGLIRLNANGTLDGTFGSRAGVVTPFLGFLTASVSALAIQTNGDIVAVGGANNGTLTPAGPFALARYLSTGQLDSTFGTAGLVTTRFGSTTQAVISAVTLQTDGKIVVAGTDGAGNFVVARYLGQ